MNYNTIILVLLWVLIAMMSQKIYDNYVKIHNHQHQIVELLGGDPNQDSLPIHK